MVQLRSLILVMAAAASLSAGAVWAQNAAPPEPKEPVWVGIAYVAAGEDDSEYLIGTIEKSAVAAIESGTFEGGFVRVSSLRIEETDEHGTTIRYWDASDSYDFGTILVEYERIITIQFKKGDPLQIAAKAAGQ